MPTFSLTKFLPLLIALCLLPCLFAGRAGAQTAFVTDSFTDTSGTALTSHTGELGATWTAVPGFTGTAMSITTAPPNQTSVNGSAQGMYYASGIPASADYDVAVDLNVGASAANALTKIQGVLGRASTTSDTAYWAIYEGSLGYINLYKRVSGVNTRIGTSFAFTPAASTTYRLKLSMRGTTLVVYLGGAAVIATTDATISATGRAGLEDYTTVAGNGNAITYDNFSATSAPVTTTLTSDNAGFNYSGKWAQAGSGASARATTLTSGNQVQAFLTGTTSCQLNFDTTLCAAGQYPDIVYQVDGGGWNRATLDSAGVVSCIFPTFSGVLTSTFTSHTLSVMTEGVFDAGVSVVNVWGTQAGAVKFSGVTVDGGGTLLTSATIPAQIEFDGDSITNTARELGGTGTNYSQTYHAAHIGWPVLTAQSLGMAAVCAGYSGDGLVKASNGGGTTTYAGVPLLGTAFGSVYSGVAYSPATKPVVTVLCAGTNDQGQSVLTSTFQSAYQGYLSTVRTAYPATLIENVILPSMSSYASAIPAAITALADSRARTHDYSSGLFVSGDYASDGVHLNLQGNAKLAARLSNDIKADLSALGIKYQPTTGGTKRRIQ